MGPSRRSGSTTSGTRQSAAHFGRFRRRADTFGHTIRYHEDALRFLSQREEEARRLAVLEAAYLEGAKSSALSGLVRIPLYAYQREGTLFLARTGRALLGDDGARQDRSAGRRRGDFGPALGHLAGPHRLSGLREASVEAGGRALHGPVTSR